MTMMMKLRTGGCLVLLSTMNKFASSFTTNAAFARVSAAAIGVQRQQRLFSVAMPDSIENDGTAAATSSSATSTDTFQPTVTPQELSNPVVLYDGVCNFCNTWVDILLRIDLQQKFKFAPLQSTVGKSLLVSIGKEADDISSVVLVASTGESYDKSRCVLKVVEELGHVAALASKTALAVVPEQLRDTVYDTVAENRYNLMGKRDECRCSDPQFADRFLLD